MTESARGAGASVFLYNLRLAVHGLRRNAGFSCAIAAGLALASGICSANFTLYLRWYTPRPPLSPVLHQVELPHGRPSASPFIGGSPQLASWTGRLRVTYPEYETLAASRIPARQTATTRARLLVAGGGAARVESVRFVDADFFPLFAVPIARGRSFSPDEDGRQVPVAVLGRALHRRLFPGEDGVGRRIVVDGHPFQIIGVAAHDQPYRPTWDLPTLGAPQDALYLPFSWFAALAARPELPLFQSPVGPHPEDLPRSDAVFVAFWVELTSEAQRTDYRRYLAAHFPRHQLRDLAGWVAAFGAGETRGSATPVMIALVLTGAAFTMSRLLLAQGLSRRAEIGIHRALGASRQTLFGRQLLEAALLSLAPAVLGVLISGVFDATYNRLVADNDIPVEITGRVVLFGLLSTLATGLAAALYPAWRLAATPPLVSPGKL
jgi:putative ABC transport system permease protein